ncbi:hypothetical protein HYALB_00009403 [Hymenoscyphus albidus]|uniref:NWD NACHT-NTPase N-terminal domain-containing protein n=1 Tax=Hymenoscyphus albidus TaxID=595503 RepID=A0A9N9PUR9_9HELO|nr:hypothetical protein HYALB_00009403 [Hymenoscyphus albidus]
MASPTDVIADAFQKLKRSLSEDDAYNFASTELQDVWVTVREIDSEQRKRQSAQNLRRVDPLLRGLEKYRKVIEVLCNGTPYMPYIWAPIKLMLEIAIHHRDVFEALLSAYADIAAALPRFDCYNKTFHDNLEFQHALAALGMSYFSPFEGLRSTLRLHNQFLKKQRDFVDIEAASFHIVQQKESRSKLHEGIQHNTKLALAAIEQNEKQARIFQLQHSIAWLGVDGRVQESEYERLSKRRQDKTCEWIMKEAIFENWIRDDLKRSCLWLDGKPGSGKSVMCSYLIQKLTAIPDLTVS